jgi:predicted alpha/beta superfamily hydrolase
MTDQAPNLPDTAPLPGTLVRHPDFPSLRVASRNVDVWLPPGYEAGGRRFPVIYMHDGQNLFDPRTSFTGVDWGVAQAVERLMAQDRVQGAILVGVWNTPQRVPEYMPRKPFASSRWALATARHEQGELPLSDDYLRFLVEELKPYVDAYYRTRPGVEDTFIMGSSMGGLISIYAVCEYPEVFGGAGCLSTAWSVVRKPMIPYLRATLPRPGVHKVYFDRGTEALDASYASYQRQVDQVMREVGYREGEDWMTQVFAGADHSERAWRERVHIPLEFLLSPRPGRSAGLATDNGAAPGRSAPRAGSSG